MSLARSSQHCLSGVIDSRIRKRRGRKPVEDLSKRQQDRIVTAELVFLLGAEMVRCARCDKRGTPCVVDDAHPSQCAECVRSSQRCDIVDFSLAGVRRFSVMKRQTETELNSAEARHEAQFAAFLESRAEVERLRRQKARLESRGAEMIRRGFESIEEMEAADACARESRLATDRAEAVAAGNTVFDPEAYAQWLEGDLDSFGEIVEVARRNASSAQ